MPGMPVIRFAGSVAVAVATALVVVALVIAPFLSPAWVAFEQDRSSAALWTGFSPTDLRTVTNAILGDLVIGPPDFNVSLHGAPVLTPAERSHMRDVRGVFAGFYAAAALGLAVLGVAAVRARQNSERRARTWGAVRAGALGLSASVAVAGVVAALAFDAAFEVFHRLFFAAGTYNFDPRSARLVQLFPDAFWSETSMVVGALILITALVVAAVAGRRRQVSGATTAAVSGPIAPSTAR